jgi:leucyl aminopeptidase
MSPVRTKSRAPARRRTPIPETDLPEVVLATGAPADAGVDLTVVAVCEGKALSAEAEVFDRKSGGLLSALRSDDGFRAERYETATVYLGPDAPARRALVVGLGKRAEVTLETVRRAAGVVARRAREAGAARVEMPLIGRDEVVAAGGATLPDLCQAVVEGFLLGAYRFAGLRGEPPKRARRIESLTVVAPRGAGKAALQAAVARARAGAAGVYLARDLAHLPPNELTPAVLADRARRLEKPPRILVSVMDEGAIQSAGMGALLAVARGSVEPPRFIILQYSSGRKRAARLALVGKGLTFDSGGLSLKPAQRMEEMKYDMCGAAAVLGVFRAIAEIGAPVDLVGVIPATENLPSGSAVRPGDIVPSYSGKTIEVLNTDAEGRLVLADALAFTEKTHEPDAIIDLATLTGAISTALGQHASGLFSEDDALAGRLEEAGAATGERTWRLPMWRDYFEHVKSEIADVKNIANGGAGAGATIGAVFLRRFVHETPWAHLDIAGIAWGDRDRHYSPRGPSGYGVRLLLHLIRHWKPLSAKKGRTS